LTGMVEKVISGGQTGADRGALDAAIKLGIPHGGWIPYKRRAEDGQVPRKYKMQVHPLMSYKHRTLANVKDSDATVVFFYGAEEKFNPMGPSGSKLTEDLARRRKKPLCSVDLELHGIDGSAGIIINWIDNCEAFGHPVDTLNVAGKRESQAPGIQKAVKKVMLKVLEHFLDGSVAGSNEGAIDESVDGGNGCTNAGEEDETEWEDL